MKVQCCKIRSLPKPAFLITIDTEGDNLWAKPGAVTTRNASFLPRFQALCERYGLMPVWLVNYEMVRCPEFVRFGRDVLRRCAGEIGAHLHAWDSPPLVPPPGGSPAAHSYVTEYPLDIIREKVSLLTRLLEDAFETPMTSHRAGRWGFDGTYARVLLDCGYRVDCSVTPGISWAANPGALGGGPDFSNAPRHPYRVDLDDVTRPGSSALLEVPVTIGATSPRAVERLRSRLRCGTAAKRVLSRMFPPLTWMRPNGSNLRGMLRLMRAALEQGAPCIEFMLHSSELMPGGSPTFPDEASIENLYRHLDTLFAAAAPLRAATLTGFAGSFPVREA